MAEAVRALIGIALIVLCVVLIVWVLSMLGVGLPPMAVNILYVIAVLIVVLWIVRLLRQHWGGWFP